MKYFTLVSMTAMACILIFAGGCGTMSGPMSYDGFEPQPGSQKSQYDWFPTKVPHTKEFVDFKWDDKVRHSGQRSVSIEISPTHPDEEIFYNWTKVFADCTVGRSYELSGWIKAENLGGVASLLVQCWDDDSRELLEFVTTQKSHPITGTSDWTEVGNLFTVPEGTTEVRIRAGLSTSQNRGGRVWFDDIQVREFSMTTEPDSMDVMKGMWVGTLDAGQKLRLVLKVVHSKYLVTIDSVDQGAYGMIVNNLTVNDDQVSFELKNINASYSGILVNSNRIEGNWKQGMELPFTFERTIDEPKLNRPQEPKEPFPYSIEEVAYSFDPNDIRKTLVSGAVSGDYSLITMKGILTLPPGAGPHPCVLLITGSGPQDRNETIMKHQPFWVLADHLSRRGLAVLRVDDRGTGQSTGHFHQATTEDFAKDATAGFFFLQKRDDIAGDRVALLGHSEGGLIAPMVAVKNPEVAAIVLMAGPGVDGRQVLRLQTRLMFEAQGVPSVKVKSIQDQQEKLMEILFEESSEDGLSSRLDDHFTETYQDMIPAEQEAVGSLDSFLKAVGDRWKSPWMRWFITHDPAPTLQQVRCPVLALNGSKDLQVDSDQNIPAIAAALAAGGAKDYSTLVMPDLNHLFQHCQTGSLAEYAQIEETLAPEFLEAVTKWLQERLLVTGP